VKKFRWIVILLLALVITVALGKDLVARVAVSTAVRWVTGLRLEMASLEVGVLSPVIRIRHLRVYNPEGFPEPLMADFPEIAVRYRLSGLLARPIHLQEVTLDLEQFMVVKDSRSQLNLDALKVVQASKPAAGPRSRPTHPSSDIHIDVLDLRIGTVIYKEYGRAGPPVVREFPVQLDERYEQITNLQGLGALIVSRALVNTAIANLTHLDVQAIHSLAVDSLGGAAVVARHAIRLGSEAVGTVTGGAKKAAGWLKKVLPGEE